MKYRVTWFHSGGFGEEEFTEYLIATEFADSMVEAGGGGFTEVVLEKETSSGWSRVWAYYLKGKP